MAQPMESLWVRMWALPRELQWALRKATRLGSWKVLQMALQMAPR